MPDDAASLRPPPGPPVEDFRLNITANTGWPAGQISSFQV